MSKCERKRLYVRSRRLVTAAEALSAGHPDILDLALSCDYGSHEAFSRAFKAAFGRTPEQVRRGEPLRSDAMRQPARPPETSIHGLDRPRFQQMGLTRAVGLSRPQGLEETQAIASQWGQFMAVYHDILNKTASAPLGITMNMDEEGRFDYVCAAEVSRFSGAPKPLLELQIPPQTYAVFTHWEHVSALRATYAKIWNDWFPSQSRVPVEAASLERHLETFDPSTGVGGIEVWIPVTPNSSG